MAVIDLCATVGANPGQIACDTKRGQPKKIIIGNAQFDSSDWVDSATFKAAMLDAIRLANGTSGKMFPSPEFSGMTDGTEANTTATTGYGVSVTLREGRPIYTFDIRTGINTEKQLRKFNGSIVPVMVFDDQGNIWGRLNADGNFVGIDAELFTSAKPFDDGNEIKYTRVTVAFQSMSEYADDAAFVNTDFSSSDIEGLLDATLYEAAANSSNVFKIGAKFVNAQLGNDISFWDTYKTEMADDALWTATVVATGVAHVITSVAPNAAGYWDVTLDSTQFTALSSGAKIKIGWAAPGTLNAADVVGIEGIAVVVDK